MKNTLTLAVALISLISYGISSQVQACDSESSILVWATPPSSAEPITIKEAQAQVLATDKVIVTLSESQPSCGTNTYYTVKDSIDHRFLVNMPIPNKGDGRFLIARVQQILQTPKADLKRLARSFSIFFTDKEELEAELSVSAHFPNGLPLNKQFTANGAKQITTVTTEFCSNDSYTSSLQFGSGSLQINTTQYIPGRTDYSATTIYKKGDLRLALLKNSELMNALVIRADNNIQFCRIDHKPDWVQIRAHLAEIWK